MFREIKRPFLLPHFDMTKLDNFNEIDFFKKSYILDNTQNTRLLRFPGFTFSFKEDANYYYNNFYKKIENEITPPRGNLSRDNKYIFMGIKPGSFLRSGLSKDQVSESAWFFGPSSEYLYKLLIKKNIYPYFTNVYRTFESELNKDISTVLEEINIIKNICKDVTFVFMGEYKDFDRIIEELNLKKYQYKKIWHPSFIARNGGYNFNQWVRRFN